MMSRYSGKQDNSGPKVVTDSHGVILSRRPNKGVAARTKEAKRIEAEVRNEDVNPFNTKAIRLGSVYDPIKGRRIKVEA